MATLLEDAQRAAEQKLKSEKAEEAASLRRRKKALRERKINAAIRLTRIGLFGEAFLKAHEAEKLTPQHLAMINDVLLMLPETDRGKDWDVMAPFLLSAKPKAVPKPDLPDAAE